MTNLKKTPSLFDYFAGAVLANGIVVLWGDLIAFQPLLVLTAIPVYCLAAGLASYFVCQRISGQHLSVGLRTAIADIGVGLLIMTGFSNDINLGLILILLVCYIFGGIGGAYLVLRGTIKGRNLSSLAPPTN